MPRPLAVLIAFAALLVAAPAAQAADVTVTSFDGTHILAHWFPVDGASAAKPAPTILMGPGWGGAGDQAVNGTGSTAVGIPGIKTLHDAGYNVLTWDPRGFGASGGTVETDSPDFERRDTQKLIDLVATEPEAQLDKPGDPRMGMAGASYGGGIQLVTAAFDRRVDAIAPSIAWNSLITSLSKDATVKSGWAGFLYGVAASRQLDPHIKASYDQGLATGILSADNRDWFATRGPGALVKRIKAPTLFIQGTVDTLFTLDEAAANYAILRRANVPTKMLWFCGGHGACLTAQGDPNRAVNATIAWLGRYVKRDGASTGARFDAVDQNGKQRTWSDFPVRATGALTATGKGTLALQASGGAGPATIPATAGGLGSLVAPLTPAKASGAVNVKVRARSRSSVLGAPTVDLTYRGKAVGARPARVFAQLVDDATGFVLGNQITPIPVVLDGRTHKVTRPLEMIDQAMKSGSSVTLQLVATTVAYAQPRLGGSVRFSRVRVSLPTVR